MPKPTKDELPNILVVDDDRKQLSTLKRLLSKLDAKIYEVDSGQKALASLLKHEFMLILLDIKMPEMDGFETAQLIRDNKKSQNIPIIFMTSYSKDEFQINEGYKLGAIDYLFKPINKDILLSKVDIFLRFFIQEKEKIQYENEKKKEVEIKETYKHLINQLEEKNKELERSHLAALNMMEDANYVRKKIEKSETLIKTQADDLEQFAYTATHDIKAPINNIESCLALLQKDPDIKNETSLMALEWIDKSVDQCKKLIQNLVTVVKVKGESNHVLTKINMFDMLETVKHSLRSEIEEHDVSITYDFDTSKTILYPEPHMESLLLNLMTNAIKYRSQDTPPEITISIDTRNECTRLFVKDNGIGIDMDRDSEKVFGLFKRANREVEGTGMGLYIVNETLKKLGCKMELKSKLGEGSTFIIFFKN